MDVSTSTSSILSRGAWLPFHTMMAKFQNLLSDQLLPLLIREFPVTTKPAVKIGDVVFDISQLSLTSKDDVQQ